MLRRVAARFGAHSTKPCIRAAQSGSRALAASKAVRKAGAAAALGGVLRLMGGEQGITPALPITWIDLIAVTPCPIWAALVAAVAARITARRLIQRL